MTFEKVDAELPNGFHDAKLYGIVIDYVAGSAILRMDFWVGSMEGPNREEYRPAELRVTGLYFCSMDVPDPTYRYVPHGFSSERLWRPRKIRHVRRVSRALSDSSSGSLVLPILRPRVELVHPHSRNGRSGFLDRRGSTNSGRNFIVARAGICLSLEIHPRLPPESLHPPRQFRN